MTRRIGLLCAVGLLAALGAAGCGSDDDEGGAATTGTTTTEAAGLAAAKLPSTQKATLVLDFVPNAVHAGIYQAVADGLYDDVGIDLRIIQPTSTADTLKLIDAGKAQFGIADGIDVANQIDAGRDAKGIMALVQRPLGGLITRREDGISTPKALEGKRVGVTGVPSDDAILETVVRDDGGDPSKVEKVTIGFNGVQNLTSGKVQAFTGFWPADGVQVQEDGTPTRIFKLDEHGGPRYPGLVVFSTQDEIRSDPALMRAFVAATVEGYRKVIADPKAGLDALLGENRALKKGITEAQLEAYGPLFQGDAATYGRFDGADLQALAKFLTETKLVERPLDPARYATNEFVPEAAGS